MQAPIVVHDGIVYAGSHDDSFYALAAGFPDNYVAAAVEPAPQPEFQPLSSVELKRRLTEAFGSQRPVFSTVATFGPDGKTIEERDGSDLVIEIFENGYYLLTGRTVQQDGWEARYFSVEDYNMLADERGNPGLKRTLGWCCIRIDDGLALIMRADRPLDSATATTAHEAGHALQQLVNPAQSKGVRDSLLPALYEAQAFTLEVALTRKIGEYTRVETARFPSGYRWSEYLDRWRQGLRESIDDLSQGHDRGRLIMWQAVLNDPELAHLREELFRDGHVSADSMLDMYHRFVSLTPSEVGPYVESITVDPLSDDLNRIFGTVNKRINFSIEFPDLVLNVPTLVISP